MKNKTVLLLILLIPCYAMSQVMNTEKLIENCKNGVVFIQSENSLGTGFLVTESGHIVTNHHVIEGGKVKFIEFSDGRKYENYYIAGRDREHDLALIKLMGFSNKNYSPLSILGEGNAADGIEAATIGHPRGSKWSINRGIISKAEVLPELDFIAQIDVPVNPGNSGGPLFNKNGLVIGVVTARLEKKHLFDRDIQNMNFAITATQLRIFLSKHRVNYSSKAPIQDTELTTASRKLSKEEEAAAKKANLEAIQAEDEAKKKLIEEETNKEKERIAQEKEIEQQHLEHEKQLENLNAQQKKKLQQQDYEAATARKAMKSRIELQRLEEQKEREWMRLERDKLQLKKNQLAHQEAQKEYFAALPGRFSIRFGAGAQYYLGAIQQLNAATLGVSQLSWQAQGMLGYRFDIKEQMRGSSLIITGRLGNLSASSTQQFVQQQNISHRDFETIQLFYEWEAGFLLKEWFRISAGMGKQQLAGQSVSTKNYGVGTLGFILRFGEVELDLNNSILFGGVYQRPALRTELSLLIHFKMGKF